MKWGQKGNNNPRMKYYPENKKKCIKKPSWFEADRSDCPLSEKEGEIDLRKLFYFFSTFDDLGFDEKHRGSKNEASSKEKLW